MLKLKVVLLPNENDYYRIGDTYAAFKKTNIWVFGYEN